MAVVSLTQAAGQGVADHELARRRQDGDHTSSSDTRSIPASKASSFGESTSSQVASQQDGKNTSQAPAFDGQLSATSSQNSQRQSITTTAPLMNSNGVSEISSGGAVPLIPRIDTSFTASEQSNARLNAFQNDLKQGQKRTASGHIKTPSSSTMTSPASASTTTTTKGHTRQSSSTSQVSELSAQLKARLSYAFVKVQHGWESRTIDEVETLASQQPSPMSTTPASPRRNFDSPRTTTRLHDETPGFTQSSVRTTLPPDRTMPGPRLNGIYSPDPSNPSSYPTYAYAPTAPSELQPRAPSLAPPVDFSRHPRRISKPLPPHPAMLNGTRQLSNLSTSSSSSVPAHPATPPQPQNPAPSLLKTPSQRATAMEKDAIETLLFMSSPGHSQGLGQGKNAYGGQGQANSQYPNHAQAQGRLANGLGGGSQRMGRGMGVADEGPEVEPRKKQVWETGGLRDEESIDRVLDQMQKDEGLGGESSSDEEEGGTGKGAAGAGSGSRVGVGAGAAAGAGRRVVYA